MLLMMMMVMMMMKMMMKTMMLMITTMLMVRMMMVMMMIYDFSRYIIFHTRTRGKRMCATRKMDKVNYHNILG